MSGDTNGYEDVFIRDGVNKTTKRLSRSSVGVQGNQNSDDPFISADGRFVAFDSHADNLIASDANAQRDVFIRGPLH